VPDAGQDRLVTANRAAAISAWLCLATALCLAPFSGVRAAPPTACAALANQIDALPSGPGFLASFPTAPAGPLGQTAFLYDNALAVLALVGCGDVARARRIGDAMLNALDHDRFWHDGRLRNGYAAGAATVPVKLSGWWDAGQNRWVEDRYQVGSDTGNMAWAMLALLSLDGQSESYRQGALRIGHWVAANRDDRGAGGFSGGTFGHEPQPETVRWKSTEHNTDLTAAFTWAARLTGDQIWIRLAQRADTFVQSMWTPSCACFAVGTGEDGTTANPMLALDAEIWPLLALPHAQSRFPDAFNTALARLAVDQGLAYSQVKDGVWTEGTAQAALVAALTGQEDKASRLLAALAPMQGADGTYLATSGATLPTGFTLPTDPGKPRLYFRLPHLAATAWVALAVTRFNPFTGHRGLPGF
jgi:hypothetical protein